MDDICKEMGISKKTLYKWFDNKDAVVKAVMERHLHQVEHDCSGCIEGSKNAIQQLFRMMEMLRKEFAEIHPSVFYDLQKYHADAWQVLLVHKNNFVLQKIKENIQQGIREKLYREDIDVELMARLRMAHVDIMVNSDLFPPGKYSVEKLQLAFLEHFMLGIATLKGHKLINAFDGQAQEDDSLIQQTGVDVE